MGMPRCPLAAACLLLSGCALLDDGEMPSVPVPASVARYRPDPATPIMTASAPVAVEKPVHPLAPVVTVNAESPEPKPGALGTAV